MSLFFVLGVANEMPKNKADHLPNQQPVAKKNQVYSFWKEQVRLAQNAVNEKLEEADDLSEQLQTEKARFQKAEMKLLRRHRKKSDPIQAALVRATKETAVARTKLQKMKNMCKNPIVKHLSKELPLVVLELVSDYNSYEVCEKCNGYFPKDSSCHRTYGHSFTVRDSLLSFLPTHHIAPRFMNPDNESMWQEIVGMITQKPKYETHLTQDFSQRVWTTRDRCTKIGIKSNYVSLSDNGGLLWSIRTVKPIKA